MRSATEINIRTEGEMAPENYLSVDHSVRSWLLTTDHKRIGILYLWTILIFFLIAAVAAALMRIELVTPQGDLVTSETYNKLFTIHGVLMVWFFLIPSIPTVLGNFVMPMMLGARDVAFPRLNLMSWYLFVAGGALALWSLVHGGVDTGWTFYTPYSTTYANTHVISMAAGVFVAGFSSIITGMNFMVTIHKMRAPGLTWFRLPLFIWSLYATSLILVLATPVLAITLALMSVERFWGVGIFDPKLGGDPILFQHLFWFYSHPAVYIMILPGMGVVSEPINLRGYGLLDLELFGGHPVSSQGFQLDSHAAQRLDPFHHSDAVCSQFYRSLYHWRTDRSVSGGTRCRCSCHRHLLCGGAFSLHHGGGNGHCVHGWLALLVAENDGANVP